MRTFGARAAAYVLIYKKIEVVGELLIDYFYPKVFIWCLIAHYSLEIKCPLKPGTFTDEVQKKGAKKPRVVYDLRGNLLLIQQMYLRQQKGTPHQYLSASETIL